MKVSRKSFLSSYLFYIFVSANEINPDPEKTNKIQSEKTETQDPRKTSFKI